MILTLAVHSVSNRDHPLCESTSFEGIEPLIWQPYRSTHVRATSISYKNASQGWHCWQWSKGPDIVGLCSPHIITDLLTSLYQFACIIRAGHSGHITAAQLHCLPSCQSALIFVSKLVPTSIGWHQQVEYVYFSWSSSSHRRNAFKSVQTVWPPEYFNLLSLFGLGSYLMLNCVLLLASIATLERTKNVSPVHSVEAQWHQNY